MCCIPCLLVKIKRKFGRKPKTSRTGGKCKTNSKSKIGSKSKVGCIQRLQGSKVKCHFKTDETKAKKFVIDKGVIDKKTEKVMDRYTSEIRLKNFGITEKEIQKKPMNSENATKSGQKSIELVGNHFKYEVKKTSDFSKANRIKMSETKNTIIRDKTSSKIVLSEKSDFNKEKENLLNANACDSTSNTISVQNNESEGLEPSEPSINSKGKRKDTELRLGHKIEDHKSTKSKHETKESVAIKPKNKVNAKNSVTDKDRFESSDDNWVDSIIYEDSPKNRLETANNTSNKKALNYRSVNRVSNIIPIRSINLETAKCYICSILVKYKINITGCSHIFCRDCLQKWLKYSQHCPVCRTLISRFAHNIRIGSNDQICVRSEDDYEVTKVYSNEENFIDSFSAAFLFEAFCLNSQNLKFLNTCIENVSTKISYLESISLLSGDVHRGIGIQRQLNDQNHKLRQMREKKIQAEEGLKDISNQIIPQMLAFWSRTVDHRENSNEFKL